MRPPARAHGGAAKKLRLAAAVLNSPAAFDCGPDPPEGGPGWLLFDEIHATNPALDLPGDVLAVVTLFRRFQAMAGLGGAAALPEGGGLLDQGAWLMAAFNECAAAFAALRPRDEKERASDGA